MGAGGAEGRQLLVAKAMVGDQTKQPECGFDGGLECWAGRVRRQGSPDSSSGDLCRETKARKRATRDGEFDSTSTRCQDLTAGYVESLGEEISGVQGRRIRRLGSGRLDGRGGCCRPFFFYGIGYGTG